MKRPPVVLPITPGSTSDSGLPLLFDSLRRLQGGGGLGVLLREPHLSDRASLELALFARDLFLDGWVGVHDRVHVAASSGADAVHLGFRSLSPVIVKRMPVAPLAVGHSQHSDELRNEDMEADYRLIGPVFPTPSKEGLVETIGVRALDGVSMPDRTWAVGGIGPDEAPGVLRAGVAGVACIGSIFGVGDPAVGMRDMLRAVSGYE
jgi:thiamine-phosphate pyrophosphorylase